MLTVSDSACGSCSCHPSPCAAAPLGAPYWLLAVTRVLLLSSASLFTLAKWAGSPSSLFPPFVTGAVYPFDLWANRVHEKINRKKEISPVEYVQQHPSHVVFFQRARKVQSKVLDQYQR